MPPRRVNLPPVEKGRDELEKSVLDGLKGLHEGLGLWTRRRARKLSVQEMSSLKDTVSDMLVQVGVLKNNVEQLITKVQTDETNRLKEQEARQKKLAEKYKLVKLNQESTGNEKKIYDALVKEYDQKKDRRERRKTFYMCSGADKNGVCSHSNGGKQYDFRPSASLTKAKNHVRSHLSTDSDQYQRSVDRMYDSEALPN